MSSFTKPTETDTGETAEHFVLTYFHWDWHAHELSAHMSLYKSKAAFESGKQPMKPRCVKIRVRGPDFAALFSHLDMAAALAKIMEVGKTRPDLVVSDYHRPHVQDYLMTSETVVHPPAIPQIS